MPQIDGLGWHSDALRIPSPNYDERASGQSVDLIVIHAISLPPGQFGGDGVQQLFLNQLNPAGHPYFSDIYQLRVSAHFFVRRDGQLIQFVSCNDRAWHAGESRWCERERCNDFSIGIELEGDDTCAFDEQQYVALATLIECLRISFPIASIVGHSDIAPGRKTDPGPFFDWSRIASLR